VSFNGGKDCTVALVLASLAIGWQELLLTDDRSEEAAGKTLECLYFVKGEEFEEIESFISKIRQLLNFNLIRVDGRDTKKALQDLLDIHAFSLVIMGTRRSDPYCCT